MRLIEGDLERLAVETAVVREMDRTAIEDFRIPGVVLMEQAGSAAAEVALGMPGGARRVVLLAGAGNNAGDGFVVARLLANRGSSVGIVMAGAPEKLKGEAAVNFEIAVQMDISPELWQGQLQEVLHGADLVVDALLGTGLSGPLRAPYGEIIERLNAVDVPVLAIDIPSGLDGDTGEIVTAAVRAAKTVTFALPKTGLFRGEGPSCCGEVILADIEMPREVYPQGKAPEGL